MLAFDLDAILDMLIRLGVASALGAVLGLERELRGRWAGLRTHLMVALAAAMFVVTGVELGERQLEEHPNLAMLPDITRVVQGVAAGIGFLGAGTILKLSDRMEIRGLTTASSIWLAAAVGTAAGLALFPLAVAGTAISLAVQIVMRPIQKKIDQAEESRTATLPKE